MIDFIKVREAWNHFSEIVSLLSWIRYIIENAIIAKFTIVKRINLSKWDKSHIVFAYETLSEVNLRGQI